MVDSFAALPGGAEPELSAPRDALTGCVNATGFDLALAQRQRDDPMAMAVALVELRALARYNDEAGRRAGDALLAATGRRLDRLARLEFGPSAVVARIDGARFALLAPTATAIERLRVEARGIVAAMGDVLPVSDVDHLGFRLAVGSIPADEPTADALARIARRLAAPPGMVRAIDIEAAARGEGLAVQFQPQFSMDDDRLVGAEALVRWSHPRLGDVGGAVLFGSAAAAGSERALSRAVMRATLTAMARWPASLHALRVAINVTAADLADPALADELLALASAAGVAPARLTVEVTEVAAIASMEIATATLAKLRAAGVHAALDDFGTGYSGLAWLKRLPVDYIKIDSGFARDVGGDARDRAVLRGIIDLAAALDLGVLAEGVESERQRADLAALGCRWYQGYLRAPALTAAAFVDFAAHHGTQG